MIEVGPTRKPTCTDWIVTLALILAFVIAAFAAYVIVRQTDAPSWAFPLLCGGIYCPSLVVIKRAVPKILDK